MIGDPDLSVGSPADRAHERERGHMPDCMMPDGADPCDGYHELRRENERLRDGLRALAHPSDAPNGVLRSVAYDIAMNSMDGETASYQIQRRTRLHSEKTEQLERVLQAATALAEHCKRSVNVGPVSAAPATEAFLWLDLRAALDRAKGD